MTLSDQDLALSYAEEMLAICQKTPQSKISHLLLSQEFTKVKSSFQLVDSHSEQAEACESLAEKGVFPRRSLKSDTRCQLCLDLDVDCLLFSPLFLHDRYVEY